MIQTTQITKERGSMFESPFSLGEVEADSALNQGKPRENPVKNPEIDSQIISLNQAFRQLQV